ncbi:hypothetical protein B0T10DRAFT_553227 [Thelonectria olida]|uniref:Microbial-type PARG catalytic domain-containing protein n=1 Tax=Thelonectria olida TaxID=1576542 RepID=A0A9P8VQS0_9HYPO|nr:hypothetical protein B0T10DRAFT_553227 [Thelonectria olida]
MGPSRSNRVRPSEVAAETKKNFIPLIKKSYGKMFPPYSYLYRQPITQLTIQRPKASTHPPRFRIEVGDPVMKALSYASSDSQTNEAIGEPRVRIPFICAANERRAGGDWETGCMGYEEKLCRRSNLSATLNTPWPGSPEASNYPIPLQGGILSDFVIVCRGPHGRYERLKSWYDLPVVSVPPTRRPKLKDGGMKYSFAEEREIMRDKLRGALRICLYNGYDRVVIGDFGLGNGYRNPPQELAELWREVFLFDPDLRGQFAYVVFVFEDSVQSTTRHILDEIGKKEHGRKGKSRGYSSSSRSSFSSSSRSHGSVPTDRQIFEHVFSTAEIDRVLHQPDPRYGLGMITS